MLFHAIDIRQTHRQRGTDRQTDRNRGTDRVGQLKNSRSAMSQTLTQSYDKWARQPKVKG